MLTSTESSKTWTALTLVTVALLIALAVKVWVPNSDGWRSFPLAAAGILALVAITLDSGGLAALKRTPRQIYRDMRSGREKRKTTLQWACQLLALLVFVFIVTA